MMFILNIARKKIGRCKDLPLQIIETFQKLMVKSMGFQACFQAADQTRLRGGGSERHEAPGRGQEGLEAEDLPATKKEMANGKITMILMVISWWFHGIEWDENDKGF